MVHAEICEDIWVPNPPSGEAAVAGATVLANLSASNITIGKAETRRLLCQSQSARCLAAYLYAAAGAGESTTDLAWDGQASVFENGDILAETERFPAADQAAIADIDLDLLRQERLQMGSFDTNRRRHAAAVADGSASGSIRPPAISASRGGSSDSRSCRPMSARLEQDCYEAYNIQVSGLAQRLRATGAEARGDRRIGRPRFHPGADRVRAGVRSAGPAAERNSRLHDAGLRDLGPHEGPTPAADAVAGRHRGRTRHPAGRARRCWPISAIRFADGEPVYDITFENVQAGLRTDFLFRLANHHDGIVIGTGDLSELALGWCTYGVGDQMAHYNVNAGVPKTLIQHLIRWTIGTEEVRRRRAGDAGRDPGDGDFARTGAGRPRARRRKAPRRRSAPTRCRISPCSTPCATASCRRRSPSWRCTRGRMPTRGAWPPHFPPERRKAYDLPTIRHWMEVFLRRFFAFSQFKRSAMPNGPKVSRRRVAVAARRLARAVGWQRGGVAGRTGAERSAGVSAGEDRA